MLRRTIFCALASAAMFPAAAGAHPGGGGGPPAGVGGSANAGGFGGGGFGGGIGNPGGFGGMGDMGSAMRNDGRFNSEGRANASANGIAHADENSVLAGTTAAQSVSSGPLAGLTTGTTLYSNGTAVGTVAQIRTSGRGSVALVVVKGSNGSYYAVPANKLAFSGQTLSTTARLAGINSSTTSSESGNARLRSQGPMHASATGIAHANPNSVLYGASNMTANTARPAGRWRANSQGAAHASATGISHASSHSVLYGASAGSTTNSYGQRRLNSRGPANASATGIAHANPNSVLYGASNTTANTTASTARSAGLWRANSQGAAHASATGISHADSHSVLYGANAGRTTNSYGQRRLNSQGPVYASATGIAHANSRSVLSGGSQPSRPGVSVGMALFSNGTQVGTVYRVLSANGIIRRVLVQGMNGRIYSLSPNVLTASDGSVSTSVALRGL